MLLLTWHSAVRLAGTRLFPEPAAVAVALFDLAARGRLLPHVVASLFRVTWGYLAALALGLPLGLALGRYRPARLALAPMVHMLRPISPLAWIPIAILWFGVGDVSAIFIIFLAALWPITAYTMHAAQHVTSVHVQVGRNFGLDGMPLLLAVLLPAAWPEIQVGLRVAAGVAWLVDVAAEMLAVNSGLGFLVIDSRNAGDRYDLVLGGMCLIGIVGLCLDAVIRQIRPRHAFQST